jgi:hypothetical protein
VATARNDPRRGAHEKSHQGELLVIGEVERHDFGNLVLWQQPANRPASFSIAENITGIVFHGCQSRTQWPQFQPRRLLQCQPGPHPSAIQSTRRATPISNKVDLANVGPALSSPVTKTTVSTIIAAMAYMIFSARDMGGHFSSRAPNRA